MRIGDSYTTTDRGVLVRRLTDGIWQTDPKFMPGRGTVVVFDPRNPGKLLGPKWAIEAVTEAESQPDPASTEAPSPTISTE